MSSTFTSLIENLKTFVKPDTERSLASFTKIFDRFMKDQPQTIAQSQQHKSIIADTLIWYIRGGGELPFTYEEAYPTVGIPKEFIKT
jgi:hypothetical protein